MTTSWFDFAGVRSTSLGVRVVEYPALSIAAERSIFETVPGRSGSLTLLEGTNVRDDLILTVNCYLQDGANIDQVAAWLCGSGALVLGDRPDRSYAARVTNQLDMARIVHATGYRNFSVIFRCAPYRYLYPPVAAYALDVTVKTVATQAGSGTPSPTNVRAINGKSTITVTNNSAEHTLTPDAALYGLTGYEDEIGNDGHVVHKTAIVTPTSSATVGYTATYTNTARFDIVGILSGARVVSADKILCSHFQSLYGDASDTEHCRNSTSDNPLALLVYVNKSRMAGWSDGWTSAQKETAFKALLDTMQMKVCYQLATPVTATIAPVEIFSPTSAPVVTTDGASVSWSAVAVESYALTAHNSVFNPGTADAAPVITVTGSGDVTLTIGAKTVTITGLASAITIDCDAGISVNGATDLTGTVTMDYPVTLPPGETAISWTGTVTSVTVAPKWRYI